MMHWVPTATQTPQIYEAASTPQVVCLAKDVMNRKGKQVKSYTSLNGPEALRQGLRAELQGGKVPNLYEFIPPDKAVRDYFDVEIYVDADTTDSRRLFEDFLCALIQARAGFILEHYGVAVTAFSLVEASRPSRIKDKGGNMHDCFKYSVHITFPEIAFEASSLLKEKSIKQFLAVCAETLAHFRERLCSLCIQSGTQHAGNDFGVDLAVYNKSQCWRLPHNAKMGSDVALLPLLIPNVDLRNVCNVQDPVEVIVAGLIGVYEWDTPPLRLVGQCDLGDPTILKHLEGGVRGRAGKKSLSKVQEMGTRTVYPDPPEENICRINILLMKISGALIDDYNSWLRVMLAAKNEIQEHGYEACLELARRSHHFQSEGWIREKWDSNFPRDPRDSTSVSAGTLTTWGREHPAFTFAPGERAAARAAWEARDMGKFLACCSTGHAPSIARVLRVFFLPSHPSTSIVSEVVGNICSTFPSVTETTIRTCCTEPVPNERVVRAMKEALEEALEGNWDELQLQAGDTDDESTSGCHAGRASDANQSNTIALGENTDTQHNSGREQGCMDIEPSSGSDEQFEDMDTQGQDGSNNESPTVDMETMLVTIALVATPIDELSMETLAALPRAAVRACLPKSLVEKLKAVPNTGDQEQALRNVVEAGVSRPSLVLEQALEQPKRHEIGFRDLMDAVDLEKVSWRALSRLTTTLFPESAQELEQAIRAYYSNSYRRTTAHCGPLPSEIRDVMQDQPTRNQGLYKKALSSYLHMLFAGMGQLVHVFRRNFAVSRVFSDVFPAYFVHDERGKRVVIWASVLTGGPLDAFSVKLENLHTTRLRDKREIPDAFWGRAYFAGEQQGAMSMVRVLSSRLPQVSPLRYDTGQREWRNYKPDVGVWVLEHTEGIGVAGASRANTATMGDIVSGILAPVHQAVSFLANLDTEQREKYRKLADKRYRHATSLGESHNTLGNILDTLASEPGLRSAFDSQPNDMICCPNGFVNLRSGELTPLTSDNIEWARSFEFVEEQFCTTPYVQCDPAPLTEFFLTHFAQRELHKDAEEIVEFYQTWSGYRLTGETSVQAYLSLAGPGGNMKSLMAKWQLATLGKHFVAVLDTGDFSKRDGENNDNVYAHRRKRAWNVPESGDGKRGNVSMLKSMTGDESAMGASAKYKTKVTFKPRMKVEFSANKLIEWQESASYALARRSIVFEMRVCYAANEQKRAMLLDLGVPKEHIRPADPRFFETEMLPRTKEFLSWLVCGSKTFFAHGKAISVPVSLEGAGAMTRKEDVKQRIAEIMNSYLEYREGWRLPLKCLQEFCSRQDGAGGVTSQLHAREFNRSATQHQKERFPEAVFDSKLYVTLGNDSTGMPIACFKGIYWNAEAQKLPEMDDWIKTYWNIKENRQLSSTGGSSERWVRRGRRDRRDRRST